ncbi:sesquipedalian-2 isoform X2 [Lepidochelys kempii]|uniref:sesquipedalian-2 isoform X2 n=1 Tax=Lepidochelys kempii TaxID=8472 RepID=UPI003C6FA89D
MVTVHRLFGPRDLITWQSQMLRLCDDLERVLQTIRSVFTAFNTNWADVEAILQTLFTLDERYSILDANRRWAGGPRGGPGWPDTDPGWDVNVEGGKATLSAAREGLLESIRRAGSKTANWSKIGECQQDLNEHPSAFLAHLFKQVRMYGGGVEPEAEVSRTMMVSYFVDQAVLDIKKYFTKHVPDWPGKPLSKVVLLATFVFNGRDEEKAKEKRKQKKGEVSMLVAALQVPLGNQHWQGHGNTRGRGRGTGRGGGWGGTRNGNCNYCKQPGHWKRECPLLPRGAPLQDQLETGSSFPPNAPQDFANPQ